jgi:putative methyltransferase (TIGR04325 family)
MSDESRSPDPAPIKVWEGMFTSYEEAQANAQGGGFASEVWIERARRRLQEILRDPEGTLLATPAYLLPVVTALTPKRCDVLKILDFGGGPATGFLTVAATKGKMTEYEYHVVENARVNALAREMFPDARLILHDELPEPFAVEIIHFGSCIQYIDDLDGLLRKLKQFDPLVLLFSDVFAGGIEEFWTLQNLWGSKVCFRFMREDDFVGLVRSQGFELRLRVPYVATILGRTGALPMDNFPSDRRIDQTAHFLFTSERFPCSLSSAPPA